MNSNSWPKNDEILAAFSEELCAVGGKVIDTLDVSLREMRGAMEREADMVLSLMPLLSRLPRDTAAKLMGQIVGQFGADGDRSRYGLMNAVTATARETRDPELRWRLEEFGG